MRKSTVYSKLAHNLSCIAKEYGLLRPYYKPPFKIIRTRAGFWQRSAGAWIFYLADSEGHEVFGSCYRAKDILMAYKNKKLEYYCEHFSSTFIVKP